jgi:hypothetical protein
MDDDFIRRMFGGHRFGPSDYFNRPNNVPNEDHVSPFDSLFHSDFNRMFHEMEEMMRQFHFGHFNFVESKHIFTILILYSLSKLVCLFKDPELSRRGADQFTSPFNNHSIDESTASSNQKGFEGNLRDHFLKSEPGNSQPRQEIVPYEQQPKSNSFVSE